MGRRSACACLNKDGKHRLTYAHPTKAFLLSKHMGQATQSAALFPCIATVLPCACLSPRAAASTWCPA